MVSTRPRAVSMPVGMSGGAVARQATSMRIIAARAGAPRIAAKGTAGVPASRRVESAGQSRAGIVRLQMQPACQRALQEWGAVGIGKETNAGATAVCHCRRCRPRTFDE